MFHWISGIIESSSYFGLLFLTVIENVFPPIPSELILPFGGFLARQGKMSFLLAVLVGATGATLGSLPLYYAGKVLGQQRLKALADKYGVWLGVDGQDIDKAKKVFEKHRAAAVFGCRIIPGIRSFIAIPAGIDKMPLPVFLACTFAGSLLWTLVLVSAGWILGPAFASIDKFLGPVSWIILGGCIAFLVFRGWKKHQKKRNR